MRPYILALAFALAAPLASLAGDSCRLPTVKIIGLDYHTARARLIKAGHRPIIPTGMIDIADTQDSDTAKFAYVEGVCGNHGGNFDWYGFIVHTARGACFEVEKVTCP